MVEEQVGVEVGVSDFEVDLASDEGETLSEFEQEPLDMCGQREYEVVFAADVRDADEVEQVRVSGRLLGEIGVCWRQRAGEVGDRLPSTPVELCVDVVDQNVAAPTLLDRRAGLP